MNYVLCSSPLGQPWAYRDMYQQWSDTDLGQLWTHKFMRQFSDDTETDHLSTGTYVNQPWTDMREDCHTGQWASDSRAGAQVGGQRQKVFAAIPSASLGLTRSINS